MTDFYCKSGAGALVMQNRTWALHDKMVPAIADASSNANIARRWVWETTTGGTSNGTPTWNASPTPDVTTVTQNGVVWTCRTPGYSSGSTADWSFATIFLAYALQAVNGPGIKVFVSNNHAENSGSTSANVGTFTPTSSPLSGPVVEVVCVSDSSAPPTATATTATVDNGAAGAFNFTGNMYFYGITFNCGAGQASNACNINLVTAASNYQMFEACKLQIASTGTACNLVFGSSGGPDWVRLLNTNLKFAAAAQGIQVEQLTGTLIWDQGAHVAGTTAINTLLLGSGGRTSNIQLSGIDLSSLLSSSGNIRTVASAQGNGVTRLRGLKMPTGWSGSPITGTLSSINTSRVEMNYWDAGTGSANNKIWVKDYQGEITTETTIVRTGGATQPDGTQVSWKFVTTSNTNFPMVTLTSSALGASLEIPIWVNDTSSHTYTISLIQDNASALTNAQIWLDAFQATGSTPLYSLASTRVADVMTTPSSLSSDSGSTWAGTGGMSNPNKQKMTLTITAGIKGPILFRVSVAVLSSTIYVDPYIQVV